VDERALNRQAPYDADLSAVQLRQNAMLCITSALMLGCRLDMRLADELVAGDVSAGL
jgi:hypothetical protein